MLKKIKNIISETDHYLFKKFGSDRSLKFLENIKEAEIIFSYLNEIGKEDKVKFVGGCVRKALSGEKIDDIDLATSLEPHVVIKKLANKKINIIETGISHGTVTAIVKNKKFEITTLRKDISTDGRHANVEFTTSWEEDALRRDFTINAIYADMSGRIFDPTQGLKDLKEGNIKFIGAPEERIREDYLRILRYFRFFIHYSKKNYDQDVIQIIKKNINGLNKISNQRKFNELTKILSLKTVHNLFLQDSSKEIILNIFPQFKYFERLKIINSLSHDLKEKYDNQLVLALLIVDQSNDYEYFCHKYKVSNKIRDRLQNISKYFKKFKEKKFYSIENLKKLIYLSNKEYVIDLLLFSICLNNKMKMLNIKKLINFVSSCEIPKFPYSGDYLKKYGYKTGKTLGRKLKLLEEQWIKKGFIIEKKIVEKSLSKINKN